jgi:integrase
MKGNSAVLAAAVSARRGTWPVLATAKAGLPPQFVPHSLRHYFASTALASSIPITELSCWLGHRSIETTHRIYGHIVPSSLGRARSVLDDAYRDACLRPPEPSY